MIVAFTDHEDIADLQGCSSLIVQWLPYRLLQRGIRAPPDSCMILSSAQMLDRLIVLELRPKSLTKVEQVYEHQAKSCSNHDREKEVL
ncbi:hypothetical protein Tco_1538796 [Tanacetum coccineum]